MRKVHAGSSGPYGHARALILIFLLLLAIFARCEEQPTKTGHRGSEPYFIINLPELKPGSLSYPKTILFGWTSGEDGSPPKQVRHMWSLVVDTNGVYNPGFDIIRDLNENPPRYEDKWSSWTRFNPQASEGNTTILGDDEELTFGKVYIFAVQAMDVYGRTTLIFENNVNIRKFIVNAPSGPFLMVYERLMHVSRFLGASLRPVEYYLPPGIPLNIKWQADAGYYGGHMVGYRHGWDIADLDAWDDPYSLDDTSAEEVKFFSGVHTLSIEAIDLAGNVTRGMIEINIIPFPMTRNLLWIDDFFSTDFQQQRWEMPTETQHDEFWLDICSRAAGFSPTNDIYDTSHHGYQPPSIEYIGFYKNIIWTYSASQDVWTDVVYFTPESKIGESHADVLNYIPIFLMKGGHLWTLGRSDRSGGLASVLSRFAQRFPMYLKCEITGNRNDCSGDRSGVNSLAYKDYCVSMLDKISGVLRTDSEMPYRKLVHYDVMTHAYKNYNDVLTFSHTGLPERLDLWEEVTRPGRFFDPDSLSEPGGFTYVEVYDPGYWMREKRAASQACFHSMYRMRTKDERSALDNCTVAIWVTKYSDIVPDVTSGVSVAAPSVHFGFPLWFFKRSAVDSIIDAVFDEWGINTTR